MPITSAVKSLGGVPTLFVNGKPVPGLAYVTYLPENASYQAFAAQGYRIFSLTTWFATRSLNAAEAIAPLAPGIFENPDRPDFSSLDDGVHRILEACPDALIFPRVNVNLPRWWEDAHPEELNDEGVDGHGPRPCFAGEEFLATCSDLLCRYITHVNNSDYCDHIVGYQIAGGQTEEWFPLDGKGSIGEALRAAFAQTCPGVEDPVTFREFVSEVVVDTILSLAAVAKHCVKRRLVIGTFYGYTLETPWWQSGHHALSILLQSRDIDFISSPISYIRLRASNIDWPCMTVLDSIKAHGKLYFNEADVRTCLTRPLAESRSGACAPENYARGIWQGPSDSWLCRQLLRFAFARQLTHGNAAWWFDMWGGWYDCPEFLQDMGTFMAIATHALKDKHRESLAECAVFIDERSFAHLPQGPSEVVNTIVSENRLPLGSAGAPYDIYDLSDFDEVYQRYKAAVFLVPADTEAMAMALASWNAAGMPCLIADPAQPALTEDTLRGLYTRAGVHIWCSSGDIVHVCPHYLAIHAVTSGDKEIALPTARHISDAFSASAKVTENGATNTLHIRLKAGETCLYRLD